MTRQLLYVSSKLAQQFSICKNCCNHRQSFSFPVKGESCPYLCAAARLAILPRNLKEVALIFFFLLFYLSVKSQQAFINDSVATFMNDSCNTGIIARIKFDELSFTKAKEQRINFGLTGNEYHFIILKIRAEKKLTEQYLSIDNTSLDRIGIYKIQNGGRVISLYEGGRFIPYPKNGNYIWHTIPVDVSPTPSSYLIVVQAVQKNINLQYILQDYDTLLKKYGEYDRLVFFYKVGS